MLREPGTLPRRPAGKRKLTAIPRWITGPDGQPMVTDGSDPLGVTGFATHHLPLEQAPHGYDIFRDKTHSCLKVVLQP
jgi:hypothetical protein